MKKILLVADVSNLYYSIEKRWSGRLDYQKLYDMVATKGQILRAIAYGSEMGNQATIFKERLVGIGFETKYKTPKIYHNGDKTSRKSDWDVGIAIDIVRILDTVDVVVIATGDGDMTPVVQYVQERGKIVHVIGCAISRELRDTANISFEITEEQLAIKETV